MYIIFLHKGAISRQEAGYLRQSEKTKKTVNIVDVNEGKVVRQFLLRILHSPP